MSAFDLQMSRGTIEGGYNLAIGEPIFLQDKLLHISDHLHINKPLQYPKVGGETDLLKELHERYTYDYIVVTNGAKQAIEAAFSAFKKLEDRNAVLTPMPYWPSYPTLAKNQGLAFNEFVSPVMKYISVNTSPNNPDGSEHDNNVADIWDAAYASDTYGFSGTPPRHRVAIFSAAKLLGLSGIRVGWLCTNEKAIADAAAHHVEITTSGVSVLSQEHLYKCLWQWSPDYGNEKLAEAKESLNQNSMLFQQLMQGMVRMVDGVPKNGKGMFAWFQAQDPEKFAIALKEAKVMLVTGEACGESKPDFYRMSMGNKPEVTREALTKLREAYFGKP